MGKMRSMRAAAASMRSLLIVIAGCCGLSSAPAQGYPSRLVKIVVPQAPGGTTDVLGRAMAERLSRKWGQSVVVENVAGASGNVGTAAVAKAAPDGHTLLVTYEGSQAINPSLLVGQPFDPVKDFQMVATLAQAAFLVICDPKLPVKDLRELLALARTRTDPINYASSGTGSVNHLVGEMIKVRAGVAMVHVPFRGVSEAITNITGGHVQAGVASVPSVAGQVRGGAVRALAVSSGKRIQLLPDVPTVAEAGLDGFDVNPWWGILAPAGTDAAIVAKLNTDVADILRSDEMKAFLAAQGAEPFLSTPAAFKALLESNISMWARAVADAGLKKQ